MCVFVQGFSEDVFSQFDPVLGNKVRKNFSLPSIQVLLLNETRNYEIVFLSSLVQVWFANEFVSVVCKTPISSNFLLENPQDPSTTRITCHLPPRMGSQGSDWFNLILKVVMYTVMSLSRTIAKEKNCKEISTVWQLKSSTDRVRHMFFYYWV